MAYKSNRKRKFLVFIFTILLVSCDIPKTTIANFTWQVNWMRDPKTQKITNFFSVLVKVNGLNPKRTLPKMTLKLQEQDLYWQIPLSPETIDSKITMFSAGYLATDSLLPKGLYELTLEDERGVVATESFTLEPLIPPKASDFPILTQHGYQSLWPATFIVYRQNTLFWATMLSQNYILPSKELEEVFYLYTFSKKQKIGLISGPYHHLEP